MGVQTVYPGHGRPFAWEQFVKGRRSAVLADS